MPSMGNFSDESPSLLGLQEDYKYITILCVQTLIIEPIVTNEQPPKQNAAASSGENAGEHLTVTLKKNSSGSVIATFKPSEDNAPLELEFLKTMRATIYAEKIVSDADLNRILEQAHAGNPDTLTFEPPTEGVALSLKYKPDSRELIALIEPSKDLPELSVERINEVIKAEGYSNFKIGINDIQSICLKAKHQQFGEYTLGRKPVFTDVSFSLNEDSGQLSAKLFETEAEITVDQGEIRTRLKSQGFDTFHFAPNALEKLAQCIAKHDHNTFVIGEKRDAKVSITFDDELMHAYIAVTPPEGGRDLDETLLNIAISDAGIYRECCDENTLKKVLKEKPSEPVEFAKGSQPKDGIDAQFKALVQEVEYSSPKADKTGKIDIREIVNFTLIEENVEIMRRIPPKHGVNGRNVKGQVIPAVEALDTPFDDKLEGAIISSDDPNLLLSTCKGHPVILPTGVRVDNTITLNNVDLSTGNIEYDGSVLVKGEVRAGMKIKVTGDIIVKGVVTKATLFAKNNITVECGVIGSDPAKEGEDSPPAILKAGGDISAQYINLCEVHSGGDVLIREYISHSNVQSKGFIKAGACGGKGRIFGGSCHAQKGIYAVSLGANGGVKTLVDVGAPKDQQQQYDLLNKNYADRVEKDLKLKKMLQKFEQELLSNPTNIEIAKKSMSIKKLLVDLDVELKKMRAAIDKLGAYFKNSKKVNISVSKNTYSNVVLTVNGADFTIRQDSKGGIFVKQGDDVRWLNFTTKPIK